MSNLFDQPEDFGLKKIGHIDFSDGKGAHDLLTFWRDNGGAYRWAFDMPIDVKHAYHEYAVEDLDAGTKNDALAVLREEVEQNRELLTSPTLDHDVAELIGTIERDGDAWTASGTFL